MRPHCYDRPPRAATYLANDGVSEDGRQLRREIPVVFVDRCATWDGVGIGRQGEAYPAAHGWDCRGCRWLPSSVRLLTDPSTLPGASTP